MPFAGYFDPCDPGETQPYSIEFALQLAPYSDAIVSATATLQVELGVDPSASTRVSGSPYVTGTIVSQVIGNLQPGVVYRLLLVVSTTGGRVLDNWGFIPCIAIV
jgi:hypothetical protein